MSSVDTPHPLYSLMSDEWQDNRAAVAGGRAIKKGNTRYLPAAFAVSDPDRYETYKNRAYWIGITGQTVSSNVGMVFRKAPTVELPSELERLRENIDGEGQSDEQFGKWMQAEVETTGRFGILVDYPEVTAGMTRAQQKSIQPFFCGYHAESIINWRTAQIDGVQKLTLVVLREQVEKDDDEFSHVPVDRWRVLRLEDGVYTQEVYDEHKKTLGMVRVPLDGKGMPFDHIPFHFVGSSNNKPNPDRPVISSIAELNVKHYQVSADYMENLHIHGQLTLGVSSNLDPESFKIANPNGISVGARAGVFLGESGQFHTATAPESGSLSKALTDLVDQMLQLGAKITTRGGQAQTAEAARLDASSESSVLDVVVSNMSEAMEAAYEDAGRFLGVDGAVKFQFNTDYWDEGLKYDQISQLPILVERQIIAPRDAFHMLKTGRLEFEEGRDYDVVQQEIADSLLGM